MNRDHKKVPEQGEDTAESLWFYYIWDPYFEWYFIDMIGNSQNSNIIPYHVVIYTYLFCYSICNVLYKRQLGVANLSIRVLCNSKEAYRWQNNFKVSII